jgi:hypothetical protein
VFAGFSFIIIDSFRWLFPPGHPNEGNYGSYHHTIIDTYDKVDAEMPAPDVGHWLCLYILCLVLPAIWEDGFLKAKQTD